ncbi:polysaccharide lyase 8 family protein [Photobacterium damselae]
MKTTYLSALIAMIGCTGLHAESIPANTATKIDTAISRTSIQDYYSVLRLRWANYFIGDQSMTFDQQLTDEITKINQQAKLLLEQLTIDKQGLWTDLPLSKETAEQKKQLGTQLYSTYQRLFILAKAYKLPGGELENNPHLHAMLVESLAFLHDKFYHVGAPEWGNWWHWQLGIGRVVNNTLIILYDDLPQEIISNYVDTSRYFVPRPTHLSEGFGAPYSSAPLMFKSTGGNRTDNAQIVLIRGLLDNDESEIKAAVESLSSIIPFVTEGDGFYQDGSFIQHKDLPYSGTYGQVMLEGLGMLMGVVANTPWQANDPNLQKIYPLLLEAFAPLLVDGKMMDMVNGRAISRISGQNQKVGQAMLSSMLLYLPGAPENYKQQLSEFLKSQLQRSDNGIAQPTIFSSYQLAQQLLADNQIKPQVPRSAHAQFAEMDRIVHHRPTWSFGIAMHSNRVGNYECINGENVKGWHTADGMSYLYNQASSHYNNYWPLVDPFKLPGTTTLQVERPLCSGQLSAQRDGRQGAMNWTGGVTLDKYGLAGMKFINWNQDLTAKKSWFMFDNEVIALGANIENNSSHNALTTIENRQLLPTTNVTVNNVILTEENTIESPLDALNIQDDNTKTNVQYLSLDQQPIKVSKVCRKGNWADIGINKGEVMGCFVEATIQHPAKTKGSYAYAILPNQIHKLNSAKQLPIDIEANNSDVQAVTHHPLNLFAANFWTDSKAGIVTAENSMSIMMKANTNSIDVSISDPSRSWWDRKFTLDGQYKVITDPEKRVSLKESHKFSVDLSNLDGSSYSFQIQKITAS